MTSVGSKPIGGKLLSGEGSITSALIPLEKNLSMFLRLILQTGFIDDGKPLSALLLGRAGSGKSTFLKSLEKLEKQVFYTIDVTPSFLQHFLNDVAYSRKKFLVIEDFTALSGLGQKTREALIHILKSGIEEGFSRIDHRGMEWQSPTGRRIKFGLITSITTESYNDYFHAWKKNGFLSRLVPFSFKLSSLTKQTLQKELATRATRVIQEISYKDFRHVKQRLPFEEGCLEPFIHLSRVIADGLNAEPMRTQLQFNTLAEAHAILRGSPKITMQDTNAILELSQWLNNKFNDI